MDISFVFIAMMTITLIALAFKESTPILNYVYLFLSGATMSFFILDTTFSVLGYVGFGLIFISSFLIVIDFIKGSVEVIANAK